MKNATHRPASLNVAEGTFAGVIEQVLLFVCLGILALRTTYTEGPLIQTFTLPGSLSDTIYSLTLSGLLSLALVLWLLSGLWRGQMTYRVTGMEVGLMLFLLGGVISAITAGEKRMAINSIVTLTGPILAAVLLVQLLDRPSRIQAVLLTVAALAVACAYQCAEQFLVSNRIMIEQYANAPETLLGPLGIEPGTFQHFLFKHRLYGQGVRGFFTTGNSAASFAMLAAFAALALLRHHHQTNPDQRSRRLSRWCPIVAVAIIVAGLVLTRSKGGILAFIIAAALYAMILLLRRRFAEHRRVVWTVSAAVLLMGSLAVGCVAVSYGLKHGRLPGGNSMLVRWQYWHATAQMIADRPLTGVGPGNYAQNYTRYKPASAPESVSDPHSLPLSLLAQYGPLGLLGFLAMIVVPLWRAAAGAASEPASGECQAKAKSLAVATLGVVAASLLLFRPFLIPASWTGDFEVVLYEIIALYGAPVAAFLIGFFLLAAPLLRRNAEPAHPYGAPACAALGCAVVGVLVHNLVDFALFEPGIWMTLWAMMACIIAIGHHRQPSRCITLPPTVALKAITLAGALLLVLAYVCFIWRPVYAMTVLTHQGRQAAARGYFDRAHALLDAAAAADPLSPAASSLNGRLYLQRAEHVSVGQSPLLEKAADSFRTAIERDPADCKNHERAGDVARLMGHHDQAFARYLEAAERYPGSGRLQLRLAQTAERLGDDDAARRHYRQAIEIEEAFRRQFRQMYPEQTEVVSRLGQEDYELARRRIKELSR